MRAHGIEVPFHHHDWNDLRSRVAAVAATEPSFEYLIDILDSVAASPAKDQLAWTPRMHDLLFAAVPVPDPPYSVVWVRAPNSGRGRHGRGVVVIEAISTTGHHELIERPSSEAVPLFWRFIREKFGIDGRSPVP